MEAAFKSQPPLEIKTNHIKEIYLLTIPQNSAIF